MGNKQSITPKINKYRDVQRKDNDSTPSAHSRVLVHSKYSDTHLSSINSTRSSFSASFSNSNTNTMTASSYGTYPDLPPLQLRIDAEVLYSIVSYIDILSRVQISICCKYFHRLILSPRCLSDVWIIHGLTHKRKLWEVPMPNHQRYHRKIRHAHQQQQHRTETPATTAAAATSTTQNNHDPKHRVTASNRRHIKRASSQSFSAGISNNKKKKMNLMSGIHRKRASIHIQQQQLQQQQQQPRSLPPEKIFGVEDVKEADDIDEKSNNNNNNTTINNNNNNTAVTQHTNTASLERSTSSNTVLSGKSLVIVMENENKKMVSINFKRDNLQQQQQHQSDSHLLRSTRSKKSVKKHRKNRHFFHELSEFNVVVADFKKYLLQFSPIIKYSRCLCVGADVRNTKETLREFNKLKWVPTVMTIEYLSLEKCNDSIACDIINSFAHSLKYLSIRGDADDSLYLMDVNLYALRVCMSFDPRGNCNVWRTLPSSLRYLCLYRMIFDAQLLNEAWSSSALHLNLLHLSLLDCSVQPDSDSQTSTTLQLPPSLLSLHLKNFDGDISCVDCKRLWECVVHVDMKGHNQTTQAQQNVIQMQPLLRALYATRSSLRQLVFYEYNNYDEEVLPSQIAFDAWPDCQPLLVVMPPHWLNDERFKKRFQGALFSATKMDIVYYYDEDDDDEEGDIQQQQANDADGDDDEDEDEEDVDDDAKMMDGNEQRTLLPFNDKEKVFRKELRQRVGYSVFADFYNMHYVGEFNLAKFVRNGHHTHMKTRAKQNT